MIAKSKIAWAINETTSMKRAAQLLDVSYNTFKKYAKMYELFQPAPAPGRYREGGKPVELSDILSGKNPNYSTAKLQKRLCREGYLAEECSNCGYDDYREKDMRGPYIINFLDGDSTNHSLDNLHLLCYNCFFIMKPTGKMLTTPKNTNLLRKKLEEVWVENDEE